MERNVEGLSLTSKLIGAGAILLLAGCERGTDVVDGLRWGLPTYVLDLGYDGDFLDNTLSYLTNALVNAGY